MLSSILLIRGFFCFIFKFWCTKISSYKFWNNILFSLIFFSNKKAKKFKTVILSHVQKKTVILTTHLYSNIWLLSVFIIYLNLNTLIIFIKKNAKLFLPKNVKRLILSHVQKKKKKKKTVILTTHLYSNVRFLSLCIIYLYSNTSIIFTIYIYTHTHTIKLLPKKKKLTTSCKNY